MKFENQKPRRRIYTLDGMRGAAAVTVSLFHYGQLHDQEARFGYLAVDFFFALSGYVLAASYSDKLRNDLTASRFMAIRIVRLYPLYFLGYLIGLIIEFFSLARPEQLALTSHQIWAALGCGLFMMPTPHNPVVTFPFNAPSWSLFFELLANIAFALLLYRLRALWLVIIVAASVVWLALLIDGREFFNVGWGWQNFTAGIARTLFSFTAGVLIFQITKGWRHHISWLALIPILLITAIMFYGPGQAVRVKWELFAVIIVFPACLLIGSIIDLPKPLRSASWFLGEISYAVYAIHWPLIPAIGIMAARMNLNRILSAGLFLTITVAAGAAFAFAFDRPIRSRLMQTIKSSPSRRLLKLPTTR